MRGAGPPYRLAGGFLGATLAVLCMLSGAEASDRYLEPVGFGSLEGWTDDNHAQALAASKRSCAEMLEVGAGFTRSPAYGGRREDWRAICEEAGKADKGSARAFFEKNFQPVLVSDPERPKGLFTGYFEPEAEGSRTRGGRYQVPLYRKPKDLVAFDESQRRTSGLSYGRLVDGRPQPYLPRRAIEEGALAGKGLELVWLADWADAFFMQVQGSGKVRLEDGSLVRLAYAGKTGLPYTAIGGLLVERGVLQRENMSMQAIRAWMAINPEAARKLMWENESYIFFREHVVEKAAARLGPPGAQKVALTPERSLAIDRAYWQFGTPLWVESRYPTGRDEALKPFRRLMVAQDTGTAIKGRVRGDVFWGSGEEAALIAGHMKSPGRLMALLPKAVARRLGIAP